MICLFYYLLALVVNSYATCHMYANVRQKIELEQSLDRIAGLFLVHRPFRLIHHLSVFLMMRLTNPFCL